MFNVDPSQQIWKSFASSAQETGTAIWTPASGKKIAITSFEIGSNGTAADPGGPARLILWFGAAGDTTYSPGTDQLVFAGSFAPSGAGFPGVVFDPQLVPTFCANADFILRITTDARLLIGGVFYGYEF